MNNKAFFNLLLVLTIGFSACNKENNPIDENPYAGLSQSEIVSLLDKSLFKSMNATEVRMISTVRNILSTSGGSVTYRNDVALIEFNRNQKKSLNLSRDHEDKIRTFFYNENLTGFFYNSESETSEPVQSRSTLVEYFWDIPIILTENNGYEEFTWSVEGRVFTGVNIREKDTITFIIKLNENEQFISTEYTSDYSWDTGVFETFFYENINPIFPKGFDKDDFIISCNKLEHDDNIIDDDKVQLLEMLTYSSDVSSDVANSVKFVKYEYDNQNRFTKILSYDEFEILVATETFNYSENELVKVEYEEKNNSSNIRTTVYDKKGRGITITRKSNQSLVVDINTIELNDEELPIKFESSGEGWSYVLTSQYVEGNLTKQTTNYKERNIELQSYSNTYKYDKKKSPFYHCQTPKWYMFYLFHMLGSKNNYTWEYWNGGETEYKYEYDNAGFPIKRISKISGGKENVVEFTYK